MKLTAANVATVIAACLFKEGESQDNHILAKGILHDFGFHPERLESHREDVKSMLDQLPETFKASKGGGWSFLMACQTKDGELWGQHSDMEALFALGLALGLVECPMPRELWEVLPGGMPYYTVKD